MNRTVLLFLLTLAMGYGLSYLPPIWLAWGGSVLVAFWLGGLNVTMADKISKSMNQDEQDKKADATPIRQRTA